MTKIGYGRTRKGLLTTIKRILDDDGRKTPFKENRSGKGWVRTFLKRHPELSMRITLQVGKESFNIPLSRSGNGLKILQPTLAMKGKIQIFLKTRAGFTVLTNLDSLYVLEVVR